MSQWMQLCDAVQEDNVPALQSLLQSGSDTVFDEACRAIAIFQRCETVTKFLCAAYPDKTLDALCTSKYNYTESLLCKFASDKMRVIAPVLTALEPHIPCFMERNPSKRAAFQCVLNACVVVICGRRYPEAVSVDTFDAESIAAIETLKKFGASPAENTDDPRWYTHTYDNVLERLVERSTPFIQYMASNINYWTCEHGGDNVFQLLLRTSRFSNCSACDSLLYLIESHNFDPAQCHYESGNVLHRIRRPDVLSIVLPILAEKKCLPAYLWQPDTTGKTPVDINLQSEEIIAAFQQYDATVAEYTAKKTRKRDGSTEPGCKLYYSTTHAKSKTLFYYQSTVLKFVSPDNVSVLCTWKSFPDEDGSEYPFADKRLVAVLQDGWSCYGTQCVGFGAGGRCPVFIPLGKQSTNSCTPCWNRVRDLLGPA